MVRIFSAVAGAAFVLLALSVGQTDAQEPDKEDVPTTIKVGIDLYDRGSYEAAAELFRRILADHPNHPLATYELAMTYAALKMYDDCIALSQRGRGLESDFTASFLVLEANCADGAGRPEDALQLYRQALSIDPTDSDLHYNFAVTLYRQEDFEGAMRHLKIGLTGRPLHRSSHYLLADLYRALGYPLPSMLAYLRFLTLESDTDRSRTAVSRIVQLAQRNLRRKKENGTIYVVHNIGQKTDEGDFISVTLAMDTMLGILLTGKVPFNSKSHLMYLVLQSGINALDEASSSNTGFVYESYVPMFVAMESAGYFEPFSHMIMGIGGVDGASDWLAANVQLEQEMFGWIKQYNAAEPGR